MIFLKQQNYWESIEHIPMGKPFTFSMNMNRNVLKTKSVPIPRWHSNLKSIKIHWDEGLVTKWNAKFLNCLWCRRITLYTGRYSKVLIGSLIFISIETIKRSVNCTLPCHSACRYGIRSFFCKSNYQMSVAYHTLSLSIPFSTMNYITNGTITK